MSNAARKARKRRHESIARDVKTPTAGYKTRSQKQAARRADRKQAAIVDGLVATTLENRHDLWRSVAKS